MVCCKSRVDERSDQNIDRGWGKVGREGQMGAPKVTARVRISGSFNRSKWFAQGSCFGPPSSYIRSTFFTLGCSSSLQGGRPTKTWRSLAATWLGPGARLAKLRRQQAKEIRNDQKCNWTGGKTRTRNIKILNSVAARPTIVKRLTSVHTTLRSAIHN
jgi:hypothetical protein